ncbi:16S rRNA (cytosine(1407)-C(5))-methyltransferase RsmF [Paraferrimonas sedimenticola]|uniref:Ribosomal RNA small subunit methyltransferase F n=1 Tax=Paraferrimonas sedimenticola TaxID=375674 RepID=A0AA37W063_9GAMM|nr:16S rRNA (cytosine(1407)-C(5))-methyltransferase RsmF [Paraferrimonas sedimenticola]GLP98081.1 ribosomal RNA small subunit methyltransferase F [Paraferrimonas sedimenticola]
MINFAHFNFQRVSRVTTAPLNPHFLAHIETIMPEHLSMDEFVDYCQRPLRKAIRVNTLKISVDDFIERMSERGWQLAPVPWCDCGFWLSGEDQTQSIANLPEHLSGLFYIQEASSMMPPSALFKDLPEVERLLDVASAPGSKTTQIAALMNNQGVLVANEYSASRIKGLYGNLQRLGIKNTVLTNFDGHVFGHYMYECFDAIQLDAPCGGEGTIRKDKSALDNWGQAHIDAIAQVQKGLMLSAFRALKVGGEMVYSTCTLNHQENQEVCAYLKDTFGEAVEFVSLSGLFEGCEKALTPEGFLHIWPQIFDSEGFFVARIRKTASVPESDETTRPIGKLPFKPASRKQVQLISQYFSQQFGIDLAGQGVIYIREQEFWLFPEAFEPLIGKVRFGRIGIRLADQLKKGFKTHHDAVMALAKPNELSAQVNAEGAKTYLMGRDVPIDTTLPPGECIVVFEDQVLGLAKPVAKRLKNNLPRELVRDRISN